MESRTLYNGVEMPLTGYGTLLITDAARCERCVSEALEAGCRMIDTAAAYQNEEAVGAAVSRSGIPRKELFITTKLWVQDAGYDSALWAFDCSMKKLGLDYLDLYLIHQPFGDYYSAWRAMERLYEEGAVRAIGVSNFTPERLVDLCLNHPVRPMVNQIEIHPFYQQQEALRVMEAYDVTPEGWGPSCSWGLCWPGRPQGRPGCGWPPRSRRQRRGASLGRWQPPAKRGKRSPDAAEEERNSGYIIPQAGAKGRDGGHGLCEKSQNFGKTGENSGGAREYGLVPPVGEGRPHLVCSGKTATKYAAGRGCSSLSFSSLHKVVYIIFRHN